MNVGKLIVGACAALSLAASGGFVYVVFAQTWVPSSGGSTACMSSVSGDPYYFGVGEIANDGRQDIEVLSVESQTQRGLDVVDVTIASSGDIGILEATHEVSDEYDLAPAAGTIIPPGERVDVIAQLTPIDTHGFATDFEITYRNGYGIRQTVVNTTVVGFSKPDDGVDADIDGHCGG